MSKRRKDETKTTDFELEGIDEAYAPDPKLEEHRKKNPGQPWKPLDLPKLQVETPPELQDPIEHTAKIWILDRRALGWLAKLRRWLVGRARR
jgi:hypothetical protein